MSWSVTPLSSLASNTNAASYAADTPASYTPTADRLLVAVVASGTNGAWAAADVPSGSGHGLTWEKLFDLGSGSSMFAVFLAKSGASPSAGAFTATYGRGQLNQVISVFEIEGAYLDGTATEAIRHVGAVPNTNQSAFASASSGSIALPNAPEAGSRCISAWFLSDNVVVTERTNWTEIHDRGVSENFELQTQWRSDASEQTASASWGSSEFHRAFVAEIREQAPVTRTLISMNQPSGTFTVTAEIYEATGALVKITATNGTDQDHEVEVIRAGGVQWKSDVLLPTQSVEYLPDVNVDNRDDLELSSARTL